MNVAVPKRVLVCSHSRVTGRSHAPRAATRWVRYILRTDALLFAASGNVELEKARTFMADRERHFGLQSHRRLCDRFMATLPRGATPAQMLAVIEGFVGTLARMRCPLGEENPKPVRFPWIAAVHALGRDADNPHVHCWMIDEDVDARIDGPHTGPTAVGFSDMGSTERLREAWANAVNAVFGDEAGAVSARSYKRLAKDARAAGDAELAAYYDACDAIKAIHIGPAAAAAVRARRAVMAPHLRESAERYGRGYFARIASAAAAPVGVPAETETSAPAIIVPTPERARSALGEAAHAGPLPWTSGLPAQAVAPESSIDRLVRLRREGRLVPPPRKRASAPSEDYRRMAEAAKRRREDSWTREPTRNDEDE